MKTLLHQSIRQSTGEKQAITVKKGKRHYKIRNWRRYNEALVNRGSITVWIDQSAQDGWYGRDKTGRRGRPKLYSDSAIETCLTLGKVFGLRLRSIEGFVNSFFSLMKVGLLSPDYSTFSVRAAALDIELNPVRHHHSTSMHIIVDSSGAKVYGESEWKVRQYGWGKHRTWRKFHLGINESTGIIEAAEMTGNDTADADMLEPLLNQIAKPIKQVSADGAYDRRKCYSVLENQGIIAAIPPQRNAKLWKANQPTENPHVRNKNLWRIWLVGSKQWKRDINYHRRSIAENTIFRFKTIFGDTISSHLFENQRIEVLLTCKILNQMALAGLPDSYLVE